MVMPKMRTDMAGGRTSQLNFSRSARFKSMDETCGLTQAFSPEAYRRYNVGEKVLVNCIPSRSPYLVNKCGFPEGRGESEREQQGPFVYVLATVIKVHFEEDAQYYTVIRADTNEEQRADSDMMVHISLPRCEEAAYRAATMKSSRDFGSTHARVEKSLVFQFVYDMYLVRRFSEFWRRVRDMIKMQAFLFLNGYSPYSFSLRITVVNVLVLCSIWFVFYDMVKFAFLPKDYDRVLEVVTTVVWSILVGELVSEVFVRPIRYRALIRSKEAYCPSTVRHINNFHVFFEGVCLICNIPAYIFHGGTFGPAEAAINAVLGPKKYHALYGMFFFTLARFRIFGLIRHWKQWANNTLYLAASRRHTEKFYTRFLRPLRGDLHRSISMDGTSSSRKFDFSSSSRRVGKKDKKKSLSADEKLVNAANIGTALMIINSERGLIITMAIVGILPLIGSLNYQGGSNPVALKMTRMLQETNANVTSNTTESCAYMERAVRAWLFAMIGVHSSVDFSYVYVMRLEILPVRCAFQGDNGAVTAQLCNGTDIFQDTNMKELCHIWNITGETYNLDVAAALAGLRQDVVTREFITKNVSMNGVLQPFSVEVFFNQNETVRLTTFASFLLQVISLVFLLVLLSILRVDAGRLVMYPLRRMLKLVSLYSKNPLAPPPKRGLGQKKEAALASEFDSESDASSDPENEDGDQLGSFETEQLINAVTKITDLLRKCWGVAGANIISSNLDRKEEGINPCVPGKIVYAVFAFVAISNFDQSLLALGGDIMILINDVAAILHREALRWSLAETGECNKNMGSVFLMVYKIGVVDVVKENLAKATSVIFSSGEKRNRKKTIKEANLKSIKEEISQNDKQKPLAKIVRRRADKGASETEELNSLKLSSVPGMAQFTDRALIGMLKCYARIYVDQRLLNWKNDFRLGAGVGTYSVGLIFGIHAGWAVEGAVGSEHKIDATYLSPHVNMASRMMSACKQYGVSFLLSGALEELLSEPARSKVRHLDTVTVKGSQVKQKIFTYDTRHKGVNFFLFGRSEEQANLDVQHYTPSIWNRDQDLLAIRQHMSPEFEKEFDHGRNQYLLGNWELALKHLKAANEIMIECIMDQGYIESELGDNYEYNIDLIQDHITSGQNMSDEEKRMRNEMCDGPTLSLIDYIESRGGIAPDNWEGYRPLNKK